MPFCRRKCPYCRFHSVEGLELLEAYLKALEREAQAWQGERFETLFVGGGTPKNFIQQAEVTAQIIGWPAEGHHYAVQITTDVPQWGGLSGCTFSESHSWGKIHRTAPKVAVHVDATIALPFLATALAEQESLLRARKLPELTFEPPE